MRHDKTGRMAGFIASGTGTSQRLALEQRQENNDRGDPAPGRSAGDSSVHLPGGEAAVRRALVVRPRQPADRFEIRPLINHVGEMPVIDPRFLMKRARHFWFGTFNPAFGPMQPMGPDGPPFTCLGPTTKLPPSSTSTASAPTRPPKSRASFRAARVRPRATAGLLTVVGRLAENRADLVVLDALHLGNGPVGIVKLPCRVHQGFLGSWVSAEALRSKASTQPPLRKLTASAAGVANGGCPNAAS